MQMFVIVIHLLIVFGLVCVILIQSSDSTAFGSSSSSRFINRGNYNSSKVRFTSVLAFLFFATSILLGVMSRYEAVKYRKNLQKAMVDSKAKIEDSIPSVSDKKVDISKESSATHNSKKRSYISNNPKNKSPTHTSTK